MSRLVNGASPYRDDLVGKTRLERQAIRADACFTERPVVPWRWSEDGIDYSVSNIQRRTVNGSHMVTVEAQASIGITTWYDDRLNIVNPPVLVRDGTFETVHEYAYALNRDIEVRRWLAAREYNALPANQRNRHTATGSTRLRENLSENPREALRRAISDSIRTVTKGFTVKHLKGDGNGGFMGDTSTFYAETEDDGVYSSDADWTNTQDGSAFTLLWSTASADSTLGSAWAITGYAIVQMYESWDTSSLSGAASIDDFDISFFAGGHDFNNADTVTLQVREYDWGTSVTTADWIDVSTASNWTGKALFSDLALSSWTNTDGTENVLTTQGSTSLINTTGDTRVACGVDRITGSAPTGLNKVSWDSADESGTSTDPKLVVTWTSATTRRYTLTVLGVG